MRPVLLAAEDEPGLGVLRRLVADAPPLVVHREHNGHGYGALRRDVKKYAESARYGLPILLLTDLDRAECEEGLRQSWLQGPFHEDFLFRVARKELEAWLLADREAFAAHFGVPLTRIPADPEALSDPKAALLAIVARGPRRRCGGMAPRVAGSPIGPEYNARLLRFIEGGWRASVAAQRARSLCRARYRVGWLAARSL